MINDGQHRKAAIKEALCSIRLSLGHGISNKEAPQIIHAIDQMIALQ